MRYLDNLPIFRRVVELGSFTAAGHDLRLPSAVVARRVHELEERLGIQLFHRNTRALRVTEHGEILYHGSHRVLTTVAELEADIVTHTERLNGIIRVAAPLALGRLVIAPQIPLFHDIYPGINVRLRLTDHEVDLLREGVDVAFRMGAINDSNMRMRGIAEYERVFAASPAYLNRRGRPKRAEELLKHDCLMLRFPGTQEYVWPVESDDKRTTLKVSGPMDADDSGVLLDWALKGCGVILVPRFEIVPFLAGGQLEHIPLDCTPSAVQLAMVYPHRDHQDPKIRVFIDYMAKQCKSSISQLLDE